MTQILVLLGSIFHRALNNSSMTLYSGWSTKLMLCPRSPSDFITSSCSFILFRTAISDQEIAKAASDALKWNVRVPSTVQISVEDGVVILRGEVDWQYQRDAATSTVSYLTGVRQVKNHLAIHQRPQPEDVKQRIEQALVRSAEADAKQIRVSTQNGKVVLSGRVRSQAELRDVKWAAWAAPGVMSVESNLAIV